MQYTYSPISYPFHTDAATLPGLRIMLNNIDITENEVNITSIGGQPSDRYNPGSTLACVTDEVNRNCCRNIDTTGDTRIGGWYHNNQAIVAANAASGSNIFVNVFAFRQVRLAVKGVPTTIGVYTCRVPHENGTIIQASISVINVVAGKLLQLYHKHDNDMCSYALMVNYLTN